MNNKLEVIGIDHGWSMMKTVTQVFVTGVKEITTTPALFGDVLEYDGKYYKIGTVRQEVKDTKVEDDSFYLLTLAAVAKELKKRGLSDAKVFLAVGLPLTRFGAERNNFIKYLTKNKRVDFRYENEAYHIAIDDVAVFPQCYAAVVDKIPTMAKKTLVVDIGSWTIDIMPVINKSPDESKCVTVPRGLITCMRSINEQCVRQLNGEVDETEIQNIMRYGRSDIDDEYLAIIKAEITKMDEIGMTDRGWIDDFILHYEKCDRTFERGQTFHNFNDHDYMVLEALSPRNLVVMDMKSGSLTIALGATEYKRYPKDEEPTKDNTTIGVSWEHGIYLGSTLSQTNFKAYKREYGTPEKIKDVYDYRAKLKQKFYFYQDLSKDDDIPKNMQNDFLHQMYKEFGTIEEEYFYDRLEDGKYDEGFKERQVKEKKSR